MFFFVMALSASEYPPFITILQRLFRVGHAKLDKLVGYRCPGTHYLISTAIELQRIILPYRVYPARSEHVFVHPTNRV